MASLSPVPVLFCTDDNYWQHMGTTIASLLHSNPAQPFRIIVCSANRNLEGEAKIRQITSNVEFVQFNMKNASLRTDRHITIAAYLRLFLTEFVPADVDRLIYLDCDVIVCRDIGELWSTDLGGMPMGAVPEPYAGQAALGFDVGDPYFNSGVLLIDLKRWREERVVERFLEYAERNKENLLAHDQDVLNGVFRGRIKALSYRWNFHAPFADFQAAELGVTQRELADFRSRPGIVHFVAREKPWFKGREPHYKQRYWAMLKKTPWRDYTPPDEASFVERMKLKVRERINWMFPGVAAWLRGKMGKPGRLEITRDVGKKAA